MRKETILLFCLLTVLNFSCAYDGGDAVVHSQRAKQMAENNLSGSTFSLGVGDELNITVWNNDELTSSVLIDPDGNIYLALTGKIKAEGLTIQQLREAITARLSEYIMNPMVGISITNLQSRKVHVIGEVNSPGTVTMKSRMRLWDAISPDRRIYSGCRSTKGTSVKTRKRGSKGGGF